MGRYILDRRCLIAVLLPVLSTPAVAQDTTETSQRLQTEDPVIVIARVSRYRRAKSRLLSRYWTQMTLTAMAACLPLMPCALYRVYPSRVPVLPDH